MGQCCVLEKEEDPEERVRSIEERKQSLTNCETSMISFSTIRDFQIIKVLGRGGFGKVLLVKKMDTGELLAMKVLKKTDVERKKQYYHTLTERQVLEECDCPFLISLRYAFQTETKLYLATEYMTGGELFFHMRNSEVFRESKARFYICEIILAMEYLHNKDILYRDLKPENILLGDDGHIKLADFGLCKQLGTDPNTQTICGTPEYIAPEVVQKKPYDKAVDFWGIGAFLYEIVTGSPPFYSEDKRSICENKINCPVRIPEYLSNSLRDLLGKLLERDPQLRLNSFDQVKRHAFFKGVNWNKVWNKKLKPPFKPRVGDPEDARNFERNTTKQPAADSITNSLPIHYQDYSNFSYRKSKELES